MTGVPFFSSNDFVLSKDSSLPQWLDKRLTTSGPLEITYKIYETVFTSTGKVTVEIRSPGSNKPLKFNGTWEWMIGEGGPKLKKGDASLVRMIFKGVTEIYEFRHLRNIIVIKTNAVRSNNLSE